MSPRRAAATRTAPTTSAYTPNPIRPSTAEWSGLKVMTSPSTSAGTARARVTIQAPGAAEASSTPVGIRSRRHTRHAGAMSVKREFAPWNATVTVAVGPLRCLATIRSASPGRELSFS